MKSGLLKRILAMSMMVMLLTGDALPVMAETVSGGDAVVVDELTDATLEEDAEDVTVAESEETTEETSEERTEVEVNDGQLTVSGGDALVEIEEEEIPLAGATETEFVETINGVTIRMSAPTDAFEEGTGMVVKELEPQEVEVAINNVEQETQTVVRRYRAFDITLVNALGEEVQPLNGRTVTVNFEGDMLLPEEDEAVEVFHVQEDAATGMGAKVVEADAEVNAEAVEMETTHFSVFVVVITKGEEDYTVTYKQYNGTVGNAVEIYNKKEIVYNNIARDYDFTLDELVEEGRVNVGVNYDINTVVVEQAGKDAVTYDVATAAEDTTVTLADDTTISFYCSPKNKGVLQAFDVTMFDYDVIGKTETIEGIILPEINGGYNVIQGDYTPVEELIYVSNGNTTVYEDCLFTHIGTQMVLCQKTDVNNDKKVKTVRWFSDGQKISRIKINGKTYNNVTVKADANEVSLVYKQGSINDAAYDENGDLKPGKYMSMGTYSVSSINSIVEREINGDLVALDINDNNAWEKGDYNDLSERAIITGMVQDFAQDDTTYENLRMADGIVEPGYFNSKVFNGKRIFDDRFKLNFAQIGDTYTLINVEDTQAGSVVNNFTYGYDPAKTDYTLLNNYESISTKYFPLTNVDGESNEEVDDGETHNCYFGMRYDFTFSIGDYVGPLEYTFAGDDDMWVFMDGKLVLDLGGMHSAYPTAIQYNDGFGSNNQVTEPTYKYSVNLWEKLFGLEDATDEQIRAAIDTLTDDEKEKTHQITVLYMERGGYDSSCYMQLVAPNVVPLQNVIQSPADLELTKVDSVDGSVLSGAVFELTKYTDNSYKNVDTTFATNGTATVTSDSKGKIRFKGLEAGEYILKEIQAPDGYYLSDKEWKITAKTDKEGNTHIEGIEANEKIKNIPIDKSATTVKTATLVDWEKRIYRIDMVTDITATNVPGQQMPSSVSISGITVTDEISSHFELCDVNGNVVTGNEYDGAEVNNRVLTWKDQTVEIKDGKGSLTKTIYVKANEEFAGGNCVPTNGKYEVVVPGEDPIGQETPYVNVKTSIKAGEAFDTIFLGENLENYFTEDKQATIAGVTYDEEGNITSITATDGTKYTDLTYVDVTVEWKDAEGNPVTVEDIISATPEEKTEYIASVTVKPSADADDASKTAESMKGDSNELKVAETVTADGKYTVDIVTGEIKVTKKIKASDIKWKDGDPIFTFQINCNGTTQTRMVRFTKGVVNGLKKDSEGYVSLTVIFDNLEKGTYIVTELDTLGYSLEGKNVDTANTNCDNNEAELKFAIGQKSLSNKTTNLEATKGAAVFKNMVTENNNESDKDMVVNQVRIVNGKVEIVPITVPVQN